MQNTTPNSNYLLDDKIMFGWYPGPESDEILETKRDVFVNTVQL